MHVPRTSEVLLCFLAQLAGLPSARFEATPLPPRPYGKHESQDDDGEVAVTMSVTISQLGMNTPDSNNECL